MPQGAPTSPASSNLVCRRLDARLTALLTQPVHRKLRDPRTGEPLGERLEKFGGQYTRYADDLTFSFPAFGRNRPLRPKRNDRSRLHGSSTFAGREVLTMIRRIIEEEGFKIQMKKEVRVQRSHQRQTATGLVVNRTPDLPRAVRRRIRAMQHHKRLGLLDAKAKEAPAGLGSATSHDRPPAPKRAEEPLAHSHPGNPKSLVRD